MRSTVKKSTSKAHVKLPDLKPKKNPKGGAKPTGFNDNITLLQ